MLERKKGFSLGAARKWLLSGGRAFLIISALAYVFLFFAFYPSFFGMMPDEQEYFRQAFLFHTQQPFVQDSMHAYNFTMQPSGFLPHYPLGQSIMLYPFIFLGWQAVFLSGLLLHLLGAFVFYRLLKRLGVDQRLSFLYILFPVFAFFSRTVMADYSSAVLLLCAFYLYALDSKGSRLASGLLLGISLFLKFTNFLAFAALLAALFMKDRKKIPEFAAGFALMLAVFFALSSALYGSFLSTGYGASFSLDFSIFPQSLFSYAFLLLLLYPLMLLAPAFHKGKHKLELCIVPVFFLGFFSFYWAIDIFPLSLSKLVTHARYLLPAMPFLLLAYSQAFESAALWLSSKARSLSRPVLYILLFLALFAANALMFAQHYSYLGSKSQVHKFLLSNTTEGSLLIGSLDDFSYLGEAFGDRMYIDHKTQNLQDYLSGFDSFIIVSPASALASARLEAVAKDSNGVLESTLITSGGEWKIYRVPKAKSQGRALDYYNPKSLPECAPGDTQCATGRAVLEKNPVLCENAGSRKPDCYFTVAVELSDFKICSSSKYWKDMCFAEIARKTLDQGLCESAGARKFECYYSLALLSGNSKLCALSGWLSQKCYSSLENSTPEHFPALIP